MTWSKFDSEFALDPLNELHLKAETKRVSHVDCLIKRDQRIGPMLF
jgi:hypothetical protein